MTVTTQQLSSLDGDELAAGNRSRATRSPAWDTVGPPALGGLAVVGLWWLAAVVFGIRTSFVPTPLKVVDAYLRLPGYLLDQTWFTLAETLIGFGVAAVGGVLLAMVLTAWRLLERAAMPWVATINAMPKAAFAPLLVVWLGFGIGSKIVLATLICFFPVVVSTMAGLTSTPGELGALARSLSASGWQTFVKVRLPWAMPQIFVGLKVAISLALVGAVVGEIQNPDHGLGAVVVSAGMSADTPLAFAAIILLGLLGAGLFYLLVGIERILLPWTRDVAG